MKTLFRLFLLAIFSVSLLTSCGLHHHAVKTHKSPPGQVKKFTGSKSAKPYAPGQNKKKKKHKNLP
ncbi:MAG: hypothetical protein JJE55_07715 [Flavobacteriaceae bacterium]|nr:hypothetical protein [Flavobacteriaceae bacterium]